MLEVSCWCWQRCRFSLSQGVIKNPGSFASILKSFFCRWQWWTYSSHTILSSQVSQESVHRRCLMLACLLSKLAQSPLSPTASLTAPFHSILPASFTLNMPSSCYQCHYLFFFPLNTSRSGVTLMHFSTRKCAFVHIFLKMLPTCGLYSQTFCFLCFCLLTDVVQLLLGTQPLWTEIKHDYFFFFFFLNQQVEWL